MNRIMTIWSTHSCIELANRFSTSRKGAQSKTKGVKIGATKWDDGKIAALYFPAPHESAPTLVYLHGNADQLGWGAAYLGRLFKEVFGMGFYGIEFPGIACCTQSKICARANLPIWEKKKFREIRKISKRTDLYRLVHAIKRKFWSMSKIQEKLFHGYWIKENVYAAWLVARDFSNTKRHTLCAWPTACLSRYFVRHSMVERCGRLSSAVAEIWHPDVQLKLHWCAQLKRRLYIQMCSEAFHWCAQL